MVASMKKRILSVVLCLCMMLTLLPNTGLAVKAEGEPAHQADNSHPHGGCGENLSWELYYGLHIRGTGRMYDYSGVASPWKHDLQNGWNIRLYAEEGVTYIGKSAFINTFPLISAYFPSTLEEIGNHAFAYCENLGDPSYGTVRFSQSGNLTKIGDYAFSECGLDKADFANGLTTIGKYAFERCSNLRSATIPDTVTYIGFGAFSYCTSLTHITIPGSVPDIKSGTFRECSSLSSVIIEQGTTSIGKEAFAISAPVSRKITIPKSVTSIDDNAFLDMTRYSEEYKIKLIQSTTIRCYSDSYAHQYAVNYGFPYELIDAEAEQQPKIQSVTITKGNTVSEILVTEQLFEEGSIDVVSIESSVNWDGIEDGRLFLLQDRDTYAELTSQPTKFAPGTVFVPDKQIYIIATNAKANELLDWKPVKLRITASTPDAPQITIQSVTLTRDGQTVNLLTTPQTYDQNSEEAASISVGVDWDGVEGGRVFLLQDRDTYVELTSQTASFAPGSIFAPDKQIYVVATNADADTLLDWKEVKLQIVQTTPPDTPQISISPETLDLSVGETGEVTVTTTPAGARYTLTSSDPEVVSVSDNTLTAHKLGRVEITATLADYPTVQAVCSVAVKEGYDDLMCAIAACQLSYEDELTRYGFGATVETFADAAIGPDRTLWNWAVWDAPLSDFYQDVLGDWKIVNVVSKPSGLFAVALDNAERNQRIIAFRGTESPKDVWADIEFAVLNKLPEQFSDAVDFYKRSIGDGRQILLTGHSLGGAIACYISLLTGERAELFNGANGLIMEDAYFAGGEEIYKHFHSADNWNFTNHVTESKNTAFQFSLGTATFNEAVAYPNADSLPVEIHAPAITATTGAVGKNSCHDLCSMLEYDRSSGRFWLTQSTPYRQTLPKVRQFEMTRVDGLAFIENALNFVKTPLWLDALSLALKQCEIISNQDHLQIRFSFGSSGDDEIIDKNLIEQVVLLGGDGNDYLVGGSINDVLVGGLGKNAMDGGPMNDLYIVTGTSDQYINDCSGQDDIYIPSRVRVLSFGEAEGKVDQYYALTLSNGQKVMLNKNRKQDDRTRFRVYSMDGTFCGSYRTGQEEPKPRMMASVMGNEILESTDGLPITTLEVSGRDLILEIQDNTGNSVGTVNTAVDSFPLYKSYGYFYYDQQEETLRAHLFGGSGEVKVSSASPTAQAINCTSIFHAVDDDLPLKRFTARIELQTSETILTPSCVVEEPSVPFKVMDSSGNTQEIPAKTEDLTVSKDPNDPDQPSQGGTSGNTSGPGGGNISTYTVTVEKPEHGKVTSNRTNASSGSTVTLTVTPDSGYVLDALTVTDGRGSEIRLTTQGGGKYTFTMPSRAVTVKATFAPLPDDTQKLCDGGADCPSRGFTDLDSVGTWYHEAVDYVLRNGLMGGYGNGTFGPNDNLSRAQFAQILFNKEGRPVVNYLLQYGDVATGAWYTEAIRWATSRGIVGGYGNRMFGPNDNITREQLAVMLWRYAGSPAATDKELHFTDVDKASGYALEALRWVVENGILNGYGDGRLGPRGQATRAQVAQMLKNYLESYQ